MALALLTVTAACSEPPPLAPACRPWQSGTNGTDPPGHCMYFPGSIALDPLGDVLYVANTNADLSFGGSTVIAADVLRHERAVACFRKFGHDTGGDSECGSVSCSDSGWALGPLATLEDTELTEARSSSPAADFDRCYCVRDLDDSSVVNCESQRFILADQAVKVGFFPGSIQVVAEDPPNWAALSDGAQLHRGLYLAVRGDPSITFIDVTRPLLPGRSATRSPDLRLNCGEGEDPSGPHMPGQPYSLHACTDSNRVQQTGDEVLTDPNFPDSGTMPRFKVPPEPMDLRVDVGCVERGFKHERGTFLTDPAQNPQQKPPCYYDDPMGARQIGTYYQYLVASHLGTGQVSSYDVGKNATLPVSPVLQDVSDYLLPPDSNGRRGAFAVAPRVQGDLSQPWYATSRFTGTVATFRLASASGPQIVPGLSLNLSSQFSLVNQDVRDWMFAPDGNRAFAALYNPPAVAILDTSTRGGAGVPVNQVTSIVNMCLGPSRIALAQVPRPFMGATVRENRLYVSCHLSGQIAEVDADSGSLLATILAGRGPLSVALNFGQGSKGFAIDPCADPYVSDAEAATRGVTCPAPTKPELRLHPLGSAQPAIGPRAYVSAFFDNMIAVLDLDPRSPSYRRVVSRIGLPTPKQVQ